jgi:hypothetical protein
MFTINLDEPIFLPRYGDSHSFRARFKLSRSTLCALADAGKTAQKACLYEAKTAFTTFSLGQDTRSPIPLL